MGPTGGQDPNVMNQGNLADIKQAVAMMMEQQQANEPKPRPPTDQEAAQLKQKAMEMLQAKGMGAKAGGAPAGPPAAGAPPPPQGMPQLPMGGPANVPPATGKDSANEALDGLLNAATASAPPSADVKPPAPAAPGQPGWNQRIDSNVSDIDKLLEQARKIQSPTPPAGNPYAGMAAGMGFGGPNASLMKSAPGTPAVPHEQVGNETLNTVGDAFQKITGNQEEPSTTAPEAPPQMSDDELMAAMKRIHSDTPSNTLPNNGKPDKGMSPGGNFENFHPGEDKTNSVTPDVMNMAVSVATKAMQAGIDSTDKAKVWLNNTNPEFKSLMDDPEYKAMLDQYEKEYAEAKQRTDQAGPGVAQYIAAALLGLAGAHPAVIQSVLHGDQAKYAGREQLAGENLMQSRLKGLADRQKGHQDTIAANRLAEQDKIANMKEAGANRRADQEFNYKRLQSGRGENLKLAMEYLKAGETAVTHKERIAAAAKAAPYLKIENEYRKKLGEPILTENELEQQLKTQAPAQGQQPGNPQSMAPQQPPQPSQGMQQASMRLLGLGA